MNRVNKFYGKDSPDVPDLKINLPGADSPSDDLLKMARHVKETQETVRAAIQNALEPFLEKVTDEYGPVSVMAVVMGIAESMAGLVASIARAAELSDDHCKSFYRRIVEQAMDVCNDLTQTVLRECYGITAEQLDKLMEESAGNPDNPLGAVSLAQVREMLKRDAAAAVSDADDDVEGPPKDKKSLKDYLTTLLDALDDDEEGENDAKDK